MDNKNLRELVDTIIGIIDKKKSKERGSLSSNWWIAKIGTVNNTNNTATVIMPNETTESSYKQNKTNQTLNSGDEVYLFSPYGTIGSAWIDTVKKKYMNIYTSTSEPLSSDGSDGDLWIVYEE